MDKKKYTTYLHFVIMLFLMIGIGYLPPIGQITPMGMKILGVFVGTMYGWIFLDLLWVSLLGLVALGLTGYMTIPEAFSGALGSVTGIQVIMVSILAMAFNHIGAVDVVGNWILTRKSLQKNPMLLVITLMLTVIIGTLFGAGLALVFMLWAMIQKAADRCGYDKKDPLITFLMAMMVILMFTCSNLVPFRGTALMFLSFYTPTAGELEYLPFMIFTFSYLLLFCVGMLLIAIFIFKVDVSRLKLPDEDIEELRAIPVTKQQKLGCLIMVVYFIVMLSTTILPQTWAITQFITSCGLLGVTTFALIALCLIKDDNHAQIVHLSKCHHGVPWDVVWLLCATVPICNALEAKESGVMATIAGAVMPLISGLSPVVLMIVVMVFLGLLTQVAHNLILGALFIPFVTNIMMGIGGNHQVMYMIMMLTLTCAYVTPAASMNSAMIHGNPDIGKKAAYTWGIATLLVNFIVLGVFGIPLGELLW